MIQGALLMCVQKLCLLYRMEPKTKKWKTDMLRSIGKQYMESLEWVLKKKKKAMMGNICKKGRF